MRMVTVAHFDLKWDAQKNDRLIGGFHVAEECVYSIIELKPTTSSDVRFLEVGCGGAMWHESYSTTGKLLYQVIC